MSGLFTIPISGLKEGCHHFDFKIGNEFFELFEGSEVREGDLTVTVVADKSSCHIDLEIIIDGTVELSCNRCLAFFSLPVNCKNKLLVKFGRVHDENDPDIITLQPDEHELDLKQCLYDYIHLSLPIQRIHPPDDNGNSTCDPEMISMLNKHIVNNDIGNDPRWDELRKIMNN